MTWWCGERDLSDACASCLFACDVSFFSKRRQCGFMMHDNFMSTIRKSREAVNLQLPVQDVSEFYIGMQADMTLLLTKHVSTEST